jgi:N-acetylneuraminic acid mutarotase
LVLIFHRRFVRRLVTWIFGLNNFENMSLEQQSMVELKARAATHGITAPVGHKGKKDTWRAAIKEAEGKGDGGLMEEKEAEWEVLPSRMEDMRLGHTAVVHGSMICAVGGHLSSDTVEVYDIATQQWKLCGGSMPRGERIGSASAVHKGKLYVVGGGSGPDMMWNSVDVYDFATGTWSTMSTETRTARIGHAVVVCEDKLYVVGGEAADDSVSDSVEVYDFAAETWSILPATMPQGRSDITNGVVVHKRKIYVVGGISDGEDDLRSLAVYDIVAEEWSVLPAEMVVTRRGCAAAVHGNKIYALGGEEGEEATSLRSVEVYDIATGNWSTMSTEMKLARAVCAAAVHGDNVYAIGGIVDDSADIDDDRTMEVLRLPSLLPWTPARHATFPHSFKRTVFTLLCCFARTNALPDDVLFMIMWLLVRSAFKQPTLV